MFPNDSEYGKPNAVLVISGKRKSGKDYVANLLFKKFPSESCVIIRLSGPLKERYALENNLDYQKLLDASEYKETFREKMIKWGEDIRNKDPGYFCRHAIVQSGANSKKIWIVSDARRKSDVQFFLNNFATVTYTIRISASDLVRQQRGWKFTKGIDDCESECGLDDNNSWNFCLLNDDETELVKNLENVYSLPPLKDILSNCQQHSPQGITQTIDEGKPPLCNLSPILSFK